MKTVIDESLKGKDLYEFLVKNKSILIAEKKFEVKRGDAFYFSGNLISDSGEVVKAGIPNESNADQIDVTTVINTANWMDSHKDVHLPGLWGKSLSENKDLYLLQEHSMSFKGIITDNVKAYTQKMTWKQLGLDMEGSTEALVFYNVIKEQRNPFMFDQYRSGYVKNHSVGMQYVKISLAINDEDYKDEFAVWEKYFEQIANKEDVTESGYFWAVKEAKVIEGSAVPIGSNRITPTLSVKNDTTTEPQFSTQFEPSVYKSIFSQLTFVK